MFGTRASGGPVSAGGAYVVGERGPEILQMGSKGGNIVPNNKIGGSTTNVVVNVDAKGNKQVQGNDNNANLFGNLIAAAVQDEIIKQRMDGGLLS